MSSSRIESFKNLIAWQKAMDLVEGVYQTTRLFPDDERYGPRSETRKSARSIPANIAEGKMRLSVKDYRRFVSIALGSTCELQTQLLMGGRLKYIAAPALAKVEQDVEEVGRILRGLESSLV